MNRDEIKVSVCVATYNHEKYIAECLQSLVDQKTNFRFEVIVGEDCSTDSTREIVREFAEKYPDIIVSIYHEENVGGNKNYLATHDAAKGEYIAHMDGDDYALPGKLQAQYDFLIKNPSIAVCFHRIYVDYGEKRYVPDLITSKLVAQQFTQDDWISIGSLAAHSSKMYRAELHREIRSHFDKLRIMDYGITAMHLQYGRAAYCSNKILGVYRFGCGVMKNSELIDRIRLNNLQYINEIYPQKRKYVTAHLIKLFIVNMKNRRFSSLPGMQHIMRTFSLKGIWCFIKYLHFSKVFKTPSPQKVG